MTRARRTFLPLLAAASLLFLASCAPGAEVRAVPTTEIVPFTFEAVPGRTRLVRFDPPGAGERLELELAVLGSNPNDFGVRLDRFEYRVLLAGREVARGALEPNRFVTAGGTVPLRFPVRADLPPRRPLLSAVARAFTGDPLPYRLEGQVRFSAGGFAFDTRDALLVEGELLPSETVVPPRVRLDAGGTRAFQVHAGVPVIQIAASAHNPGEIGYFLSGKDVALSLAGQTMARLDIVPLPLPAGETRRLELLFYPDPATLDEAGDRAIDAVLQGVPTGFSVRGGLAMDVLGVESFAVPGGLALDGFVDAD